LTGLPENKSGGEIADLLSLPQQPGKQPLHLRLKGGVTLKPLVDAEIVVDISDCPVKLTRLSCLKEPGQAERKQLQALLVGVGHGIITIQRQARAVFSRQSEAEHSLIFCRGSTGHVE